MNGATHRTMFAAQEMKRKDKPTKKQAKHKTNQQRR